MTGRFIHCKQYALRAVRFLFWPACLLVIRKCYNPIERDRNMLNTSLWGRKIWQPTCWRTKGNKDIDISWGGPENYNNRPVAGKTHFSLQMSHCHSVCLFWTTIYPLQMLKFKVWVRTFGTILDSPFVLAFVLSPSSPPFPLAHCELPRREKKKECYTASAD